MGKRMPPGPRTRVSVFIDREIDRTIEHLAIDLGMKKYEVYELGARAIVDLLTNGRLSEELRSRIDSLRARAAALGREAPRRARRDDNEG